MNVRLKRAMGLGVTALLLAGTSVALGTGSASAASPATGTEGLPYLGKLKVAATGPTFLKLQFDTFQSCPAGATRIRALIDNTPPVGDTNPAHQWTSVVMLSSTANGLSTSDPMTVNSSDTLQNTAAANSLVLIPGDYRLTLICGNGVGGSVNLGEFDGVLTVSADSQSYTSPAVNGPYNTTTTLSTSPASPANGATDVTITASISPASTGSVDFFDDGVKINAAPVPVSGGTASVTPNLAVGTHSLTASFTSDDIDGGRSSSTTSPTSYVVDAFTAVSTTSSLAVGPASGATTVDDVTLTATILPSNSVGSVDFYDNTPATPVLLGSASVSGGQAVLTKKLGAGTYKLQAKFVPGNANFGPSTSAELAPYAVTAYAGVSASEILQATVDAGALTITAGGPTVDLGHLALNATNDLLVSLPTDINPVTVTDTRAGNIHWTASGQVSDFVSGTQSINGGNLGWTPKLVSKNTGQTITLGPVVAPGNGLAPGAAVPAGIGLKSSRELAHTVDGTSTGTAVLGATVVLQAPTTTVAGTYTATLTLTAI